MKRDVSGSSIDPSAAADALGGPAWPGVPVGFNPEVRAALGGLLGRAADGAAQGRRTAVFDWDNTCIWGDITFLGLRQLLHDAPSLRLTRDELAKLLPAQVGEVSTLVGGVSLAEAGAAILAAFDELTAVLQRGEADLDSIRQLPAYLDFRALLVWYYDLAEATDGVGAHFAYPWLVQLFAGMTPAEMRVLLERALKTASEERFGEIHWRAARPVFPGGPVPHCSLPTGLRPFAPMRDLMVAMEQVGTTPYVVTASCEQLVQMAAQVLGFSVRPENVAGQRLAQQDGSERFVPVCPTEIRSPIPHYEGKVRIVREVLGIAPEFVAGDSIGDVAMFHIPSVRLALLVDRDRDDVHRALRRQPPRAELVRQGRDEANGCFSMRSLPALDAP